MCEAFPQAVTTHSNCIPEVLKPSGLGFPLSCPTLAASAALVVVEWEMR